MAMTAIGTNTPVTSSTRLGAKSSAGTRPSRIWTGIAARVTACSTIRVINAHRRRRTTFAASHTEHRRP